MISTQTFPVSFNRILGVLALVASSATSRAAVAQEVAAADHIENESSSANQAVADGAFLPLSAAANHAERKATFKLLSGYDSAAKSGLFRAEAEAKITGPFGIRAGASYDGLEDGTTRPFIGGYFDVLRQNAHGVNLALHARFEAESFNVVPGVAAGFTLSRDFSGSMLLFNAEYGHGVKDDERNAAGGVAFLQRLSDRFRFGLDSRFQIDLERDDDEPERELDWRTIAGPLLLAKFGPVVASLGGGVSALQYRLQNTVEVGGAAYAGLGATF